MAITYDQLLAFDAGTFKTSAASWKSWATAVMNHSKDLKTQVGDPLQSNWTGSAAASAQTSLTSMADEMSVSASKISSIETTLSTAAATIEQQQTVARNAAAPLTSAGFTVQSDGSILTPANPTDAQKNLASEVAGAEATIKGALAKAETADESAATAMDGLLPPAPPTTGPGSNLSSDPGGSNSGSNGGIDPAGSTAVSSVSAKQAMALAQKMVAAHGWSADQFTCLQKLWNQESGWNAAAYNKSSGAFGIPQSLPADKMASAGADWKTNPATQIKWGLDYIAGRYGNPCGAWAHEVANNWY